jgi:hypothetical protein
MRKQLIATLGLAAAGFFHTGAQATVIASNTTTITQGAQGFSKTFALDGTKYAGVTVSITAKGDYGTNYNICDDEYFNFYIDGQQFTHWTSSTSAPGLSVTENSRDTSYTLNGTLNLSDAQWAKISSDSLMTIGWQNGADVDAYWSLFSGWQGAVSFNVQGTSVPVASVAPATSPVASAPVVTVPAAGASASASAAKAVPEPASLALLGLGLAGLGFARRRKA